jgi:Fur family ferric uptake transcriptional regulator
MSVKEKNVRWFWDALDSYLSRSQLKQTKQRKILVTHFLKLEKHVDAEDLYRQVRNEGHNIGLATIYRTLNLLKDAGLVEQHSFADGRAIFEISRPGTHHDHLVCVTCGKIEEFENDDIERLQKGIAKDYGFVLTSHRLDLYGFCGPCKEKTDCFQVS